MERVTHVTLFMIGGRIGFFTGDVKNLVNDIQELKPTIFVSVPRLLNRIYDKVQIHCMIFMIIKIKMQFLF